MKKKALSLLLACTMAFSSFSMALAAGDAVVVEATQSNEQMAGDFLKTAGVLKGDDKGNLNLDQALTREQAMLMIAKLMGKEDEALNFKGESTFKDAKNNAYWAPVIAWAEAQKLTNGMGDGTFGLGKEATQNQVVTMYLRVLGYEVTWEGKELSADSQKVVEETGLLTAVGDTFNRGAMAVMTVNTLKATPKGAEAPLAKNLNVDMTKAPKFVTPSVPGEIGEAKVTSVKAVANDKIEVKFDKEVSVSAANFKVTEKADAAKTIEVKELTAESTKVVVLTVEGLTSGKAYTVKIADQSMNFTGIARLTAAPVVKKVTGTDFNRVEIEFEKTVDKATAETVANYTIEKATVVKATLNADRNKVTLETEGLVKNTLYKLTVENVKSVDAVAIKKVTKTFRAIEDVTKPALLGTPNYKNNETIIIKFSKEMDKAALENVANYKISSSTGELEIVSATASASASTKSNDVVTLKTASQDVKVTYTLTIDGLKDASVKGNALTKYTRTFRGIGADTLAPTVSGNPRAVNNNLVELKITESNLLDKSSVEDPANYTFDRDLQVVSVELVEDDNKYDNLTKTVLITTSAQELGNYKITVKGIMDEFGNALKPITGDRYREYGFQYSQVIKAAPAVKSVKSNGLNTVVVTFTAPVNKATAQDPTNYVLNGELGAATKATLSDDSTYVTLTTATQKVGKTYELTINGVEHKYAAIPMVDVKAKFMATATEADLTAPTLSYIYAPNKGEVQIAFSEPMQAPTTTVNAIRTTSGKELNYVDKIGDGEILVFKTADLADTDYTLTNGAVKFADLAGNEFVLLDGVSFRGTTIANDGPVATEADIEQLNARQIKVTFDKNVQLAKTSVVYSNINFTAALGSTNNVVIFTADKAIASNTKIEMTFKDVVKDMLGVSASANVTETAKVFTTYMTADAAPTLYNVTALNNKTVELTFSEPLLKNGAYAIYTKDDNGNLVEFAKGSQVVVPADDNLSILKLALNGVTLDGEKVYYLKIVGTPYNLNLKPVSDYSNVEISFNGSDVLPNAEYITVKVVNSTNIVAYDQAGETITVSSIKALDAAGAVIDKNLVKSATKDGAVVNTHLVTGTTYRVEATNGKTVDVPGVLATNLNIVVEPTTLVKGQAATVTVSGVNFKEGITAADFKITTVTGMVIGDVTRVDSNTVTIALGTPDTTGDVTIQANKTAFDPEAALVSNTVTLKVVLSALDQAKAAFTTTIGAAQLAQTASVATATGISANDQTALDAAYTAYTTANTNYQTAITAATAANTAAATVADVTAAANTLATATTAFENAKTAFVTAQGTLATARTAMTTAITAAQARHDAVTQSVDGTELDAGTEWATAANKGTFQTAITDASTANTATATAAQLDAARGTLTTAQNTFNGTVVTKA